MTKDELLRFAIETYGKRRTGANGDRGMLGTYQSIVQT